MDPTLHDLVPHDMLRALLAQDAGLPTGRLRPLSGGRTNRVWRAGDRVVKHYRAEAATPLFPNDSDAEVRALRLFAPQRLAPALRAVAGEWLVIDHVPAPVWGGPSNQDPAPVAQMLGRLHGLTADGFRPLPNGSDALGLDALRVARGTAMPPLPTVPTLPPVTPRPVHADAVPGNILTPATGALLIDWQCPGLGDPAEDLATFLSPAMQWLYTGRTLTSDQRSRFLDAYPDRATVQRFLALEPLYAWRIKAHCLHRAALGDADYAQAALQEMA